VTLVGSSIEENVIRTRGLALYARSRDTSASNVQIKIRSQLRTKRRRRIP
jgi:hypothetical protein